MKRLSTGKWQIRWRDRDGTQRSKNFKSRELAAHWQRLHDPSLPRLTPTTFKAFAEKWLRDYSGVEKSRSSAKADEIVIRVHLAPAFGPLDLTDLRKPHLLDFRLKLRQSGRSAKTVNNVTAVAKTMLSTAVEWELLLSNPWASVRPLKVIRKAFAYWTQDERDRFLAFCKAKDQAFAELVLVAVHTGLRKGELQALTCSQLDFGQRLIRVDATYCYPLRERLERSKNGEVGFAPMPEVVFQALKDRQLAPGSSPVFDHGLFIDASPRLERRCKALGMKTLRFHDLRHTAASVWVMAGVPLYTVQRLMRHKSITMTERYAHLAPAYLREAAETGSARNVHCPQKTGATK